MKERDCTQITEKDCPQITEKDCPQITLIYVTTQHPIMLKNNFLI